uniref:Uncharacterized protein n=1 Tax=viral metagenome TaxID=1070528 RepID=A0A6C0HL24_9ZZZZ
MQSKMQLCVFSITGSIVIVAILIAILIAIIATIIATIMQISMPLSMHEKFELTSHPCISTQLKLLNRVTELLLNYPNNVGLLQYHWALWHNNLTTSQLLEIKKNLPHK